MGFWLFVPELSGDVAEPWCLFVVTVEFYGSVRFCTSKKLWITLDQGTATNLILGGGLGRGLKIPPITEGHLSLTASVQPPIPGPGGHPGRGALVPLSNTLTNHKCCGAGARGSSTGKRLRSIVISCSTFDFRSPGLPGPRVNGLNGKGSSALRAPPPVVAVATAKRQGTNFSF